MLIWQRNGGMLNLNPSRALHEGKVTRNGCEESLRDGLKKNKKLNTIFFSSCSAIGGSHLTETCSNTLVWHCLSDDQYLPNYKKLQVWNKVKKPHDSNKVNLSKILLHWLCNTLVFVWFLIHFYSYIMKFWLLIHWTGIRADYPQTASNLKKPAFRRLNAGI